MGSYLCAARRCDPKPLPDRKLDVLAPAPGGGMEGEGLGLGLDAVAFGGGGCCGVAAGLVVCRAAFFLSQIDAALGFGDAAALGGEVALGVCEGGEVAPEPGVAATPFGAVESGWASVVVVDTAAAAF